MRQTLGETVHHRRIGIEQRKLRHASLGERCCNRGPDTAVARHEDARTGQHAALAQDAAHETLTVEHVANQRTARSEADRIAGARDLCRDRHLIQERDRRDLVRHRDKCAVDIG